MGYNSPMHPDVEKILNAANQAPSGENCQPWKFVVRGFTIEIHLVPERDQSYYGWGQRASYLANGAAIENLVIKASALGYRAVVTYFPVPSNQLHVATVELGKDPAVEADPLAAFIEQRISNRKKYIKQNLVPQARKALEQAVNESGYGRLYIAETRNSIKSLARVGATNEEVMLTNKAIHGFFFSHLTWTKAEDDRKKVGFYIKTLELPPPTVALFKLIQHWPIMRTLSYVGFHRIAGMQNAQTYAASSAIGALSMSGGTPLDYVKIGRSVERLWLTATSLDLSLQPLTGVLFFMLKIRAGEGDVFSQSQRAQIERGYAQIKRELSISDDSVAFMFRVGTGSPPSAHASRFALKDVATVA